jgi:hypothetical protein
MKMQLGEEVEWVKGASWVRWLRHQVTTTVQGTRCYPVEDGALPEDPAAVVAGRFAREKP